MFGALCAAVLVPGQGINSELVNRLSTAVVFPFYVFASPLVFAWPLTLKIATTLVVAEVRAIIATVDEQIHAQDDRESLSEAEWDTDVARRIRDLVGTTLPILSEGWARGLIILSTTALLFVVVLICLLLSPFVGTFDDAVFCGATLTFRVICCLGILLLFFLPLKIAEGPASVSNVCADLKERLNAVRFSELTPEVRMMLHLLLLMLLALLLVLTLCRFKMDSKISLLEKTLANVNHGRGPCFKVAGQIIDKELLREASYKLYLLAAGAIPFALWYLENSELWWSSEARAQRRNATCASTPAEVAVLRAMRCAANSSCTLGRN